MTDFPSLQIASDNVDKEWVNDPVRMDLDFIKKFIITFGIISSVFDFITFFILLFVFQASPVSLHTAWFVEAVISATLAMLVVRTPRPFVKSKPNQNLFYSIALVDALVVYLPFSPLKDMLGFVEPDPSLLLGIVLIVLAYVLLLELVKQKFYKHNSLQRHFFFLKKFY